MAAQRVFGEPLPGWKPSSPKQALQGWLRACEPAPRHVFPENPRDSCSRYKPREDDLNPRDQYCKELVVETAISLRNSQLAILSKRVAWHWISRGTIKDFRVWGLPAIDPGVVQEPTGQETEHDKACIQAQLDLGLMAVLVLNNFLDRLQETIEAADPYVEVELED